MRPLCKTAAFWAAVLLLWELVFHLVVFKGLSLRFLSAIGFTLAGALFLTLLSHLWKRPLANKITRFVLLTALLAVFSIQTVYYIIFGSLLSLSYVGMGGDAIGNFIPIVVSGIVRSIPLLLVYLAAYPVLAVLQHKKVLSGERAGLESWLLMMSCGVLVFALSIPPESEEGPGAVYRDELTSVDRQTEYFGLLTAERLELLRLGGGHAELADAGIDLQGGGGEDISRNVIEAIDFDALNEATDDPGLLALNKYFSGLSGTAQNEYTGMFKGYNLIQICAESYSPYLISEELTPTLYRLTHEGFVFDNFYGTFPNLTTNGEYCLSMGLIPDTGSLSFLPSMQNYLPNCLGRVFRDQAGINTLAYHDNIGSFYNRVNTHPNMGYDFRAIGCGLDMEQGHPSSDLEMMEKTVGDYIGQEPFVVHYMTYSGHNPYSFDTNEMAIKNRARVADLDCSEDLKAYYACQLELEDALTYLIQRLEEAGIADHTVIVLTGDHFPYALSDADFEQLAGDAAGDPFWRYRNSFVCWNPGMEEPVHVDDYCCTQDILPTVLNLFGMEYDSRLLTGTDVFSGSIHMAVLFDGSYLTKDLIYDSNSGQVTYRTPEEDLPENYAADLTAAVKNLFAVSRNVLYSDYYGFAYSAAGLASTGPHAEQGDCFADIAGTWYRDAVNELAYRGILSGNGFGLFMGNDPTNRSMLLSMLVNAAGLPSGGEMPPYTDLPDGWYGEPYSAAWTAGLLRDGETGRPLDPLTREDALEFLVPFAEYVGIPDAERWSEDAWEQTAEEARQNGEDGQVLSRGAAAVLTCRFFDAMDQL